MKINWTRFCVIYRLKHDDEQWHYKFQLSIDFGEKIVWVGRLIDRQLCFSWWDQAVWGRDCSKFKPDKVGGPVHLKTLYQSHFTYLRLLIIHINNSTDSYYRPREHKCENSTRDLKIQHNFSYNYREQCKERCGHGNVWNIGNDDDKIADRTQLLELSPPPPPLGERFSLN